MNRPSLEMADLVRSVGRIFIERNRSWLNRLHLKVLTAIERCRTAALGGHLDQCALWTSCHFVQLLSQQALSEVPSQRSRPLVRSAHPRPVAHALCTRRLY